MPTGTTDDPIPSPSVDMTSGDDHFFIVNGRRWRRTDPGIPANLCTQLTGELMSARRAVKFAKASEDAVAIKLARTRVHDAKLALGERGHPWWEEPTDASLAARLGATIRCLLRHRDQGKTICPSDAARVVGSDNWKRLMRATRETAWKLETEGWLIVTQHGTRVKPPTSGAIRLERIGP